MEELEPTTWTDDRVDELRRLWVEEALASAEIARRMGISRGTVMGKVNRLGLLRHSAVPPLQEASAAVAGAQEPASPGTTAAALDGTENHVSGWSGKHPTIFELKAGQCHFPLGGKNEPAEYFCGKPAMGSKPYCRECCQRAYVPSRAR